VVLPNLLPAPLLHRDHRGASLAVQGRSDPAADGFGGAPQRIVIEMRVAGGGRCLSVAEQLADDR
jgi:hypothetical protein